MSEKRLNRENAVTVICATILVGTAVVAASLALGWAVGGLMELSREFTLALTGLCLSGGVYTTYMFARSALKAEPIYE